METTKTRGAYVSPHEGRLLFGEHARRWMATWNTEATTTARDRSILTTHGLPRWGDVPFGKIDDMGDVPVVPAAVARHHGASAA